MTTKKQRRLVTGCAENMQQVHDVATQGFIFKNKFDKDQINSLKYMKRILIELIQKLDGNILFLQQPRVDHPTAGGQHGIGTLHHAVSSRFFWFQMCDFCLQAIAISV